jgi:hypothetical protein
MSTNYIAPIWRMPRNANKDKLSNYSVYFSGATRVHIAIDQTTDFLPGEPTASGNIGNPTFSASIFFNFSSTISGSTRNMFGAGETGGASYWYLRKNASDNLEFFVRTDAGSPFYTTVTGSTVLSADQWYHACVTWDGTNINLYLDGQSDAAAVAANNFYFGGGPGTEWPSIGSYWRGGSSITTLWTGRLAQASVFNYELSSSQVDNISNGTNPMILNTPPTFYYPMGDNSNITEQAYGGSDNFFPNISVGADSVFDFTNSLQYIDLSHSLSDFSITDTFSISTWAKAATLTNYATVTGATSSGAWADGFGLMTYDSSGIKWAFWVDQWNTYLTTSASNVIAGEWYHIVCTYSDANGGKMYINNGTPTSFTGATLDGQNVQIDIGTIINAGSYDWDGEITNTQFWNVELSSSDVTTLYNNGQPLMTGTQPQEANLKAWYKLNQTANWEAITANTWQIPDARSAYPQSFDFSKTPQEYIDLGKEDFFDGNNEITFSLWVNKKNWSSTGFEGIISKYGTSGATIQYRIAYPSSAGKLQFYLQGGPSGGPYAARIDTVTLTSAQQDSEWLHILWRHDANIGRSEVIFNGDYTNLVSLTNIAANPYAQPQTTILNMIGNVSNGLQPFDGAISNYQRFNSYLDNATVEALYNEGVPSTTAIAPTSSQAWYKLDNNELFDGTNWSVENQKYPANWESSFNSSIATGMLRDNDSKSEYDNQLFSMSVWVKPKSGVATNGDIFSCKGSSNYGVALLYNGNALIFQLGDATTTNVNSQSGNWSYFNNRISGASPTYTEYDQWSHIVVVWNGTNSKFYINGDLVSTITPPSSLTVDYSFGNTISAIGGRNDAGSGYFTGNISNFAYWESELDQTAVTALYNNGTPEVTISQSPNHWFTLKDFATGSVDQIGSLNYEDSTPSALEFPDNFVSTEAVKSSTLTEQSLVNNNVSALNGESSGMNTTNLVQSNLTRTQPFSNYSMFYDAVDVYSTFDTQISLGSSDNFTWSFWIKPVYNSISDMVLVRASATSITANNTMLLTYSGGNWRIKWDNASGNFQTGYVMPNNEWSHVALSITQGTGTRYAYINGVEVTSNPAVTGITSQWLGFSSENTTNDFEGYLSQCAYWDTNLSTTELAALYNNGVPQDLRDFSVQPTQYWPMNQDYSYWNGSVWINRDIISGNDSTTVNTAVISAFVGNAPGSEANGTGINLTIADLIGDMKDSKNNVYSINMADYADGVTNPANSGRSTEVPSV